MTKNVTIKDIAREAGVSIALVSFVMNNRIEANGKKKYRVSEVTRQKILEVAERMNYRPSSAARMLRQGRTHTLGIIVSDLGNIFYGILAKEFERIAYMHGYTVLFGSTEEDPERFDLLVKSFLEKDVEGFIVVPANRSDDGMRRLMESGRPFVVIDRYSPRFQPPSVIVDNEDAMEQAVLAIRKQGATRIGFVSYSMRISPMIDREKSFARLLGPEAPIFHLSFNNVEKDAEEIAESIVQQKLDGIITGSNVPCVAVIKALIRRGIQIQKDIRIVGFDYSNVYDIFSPRISYIQQPLPEIARQSADYLFDLIDRQRKGEDIQSINDTIILKAKLI